MKRKGPEFNYLRFPLFPGSLLLMEGVTQTDWAHQVRYLTYSLKFLIQFQILKNNKLFCNGR